MRRALKTAVLALALSLIEPAVAGDSQHEGCHGNAWNGSEVIVDIPDEDCQPNAAGIPGPGEKEGSGLCVWATLQMAARWQGIRELDDLFEYMKTQTGGGWPERVERILKERAPGLDFSQYEGDNPVPFIEAALRTGRPVCSTYGYGELYLNSAGQMTQISHWILIVGLNGEWGQIKDNNDAFHVTWIKRTELIKRIKYPKGKAWLAVLMPPPPPPIPVK